MKTLHFLKPLLKKIDKYLLGIEEFDEVDTKVVRDKAKADNKEVGSKPIH